jgi:hypothetical protein
MPSADYDAGLRYPWVVSSNGGSWSITATNGDIIADDIPHGVVADYIAELHNARVIPPAEDAPLIGTCGDGSRCHTPRECVAARACARVTPPGELCACGRERPVGGQCICGCVGRVVPPAEPRCNCGHAVAVPTAVPDAATGRYLVKRDGVTLSLTREEWEALKDDQS